MPPQKGLPLNDLEVGEIARIIHMEDEPGAVFAQLVAEGLHPGMQVKITEKNSHRIQFIADGEEVTLAPVVAANLTAQKLKRGQILQENYKSLSSLQNGEKGKVLAISQVCRGQQRQRMMDLGIIPGTIISMEMTSASGDPIAYNIRGATIALRKEQANMIHIEPVEEVI
jgi:DtxR family Mn-dependent transcriptional regulator